MKRITITIPEEDYFKIKKYCKYNRLKISNFLLKCAIEEHINKPENTVPGDIGRSFGDTMKGLAEAFKK